MYQELDLLFYYPESFVDLLWYGNADNLNRAYNLSDFRIKADLLNVYHIGLNKKINNKQQKESHPAARCGLLESAPQGLGKR